MQTECLIKTTASTRFAAKIRFLQIVRRSVGKLRTPGREEREGVEPEFDFVDRLEVGGRVYQPWEEAVEREHTSSLMDPATLSPLSPLYLTFPAGRRFEYLHDEQGRAVGVLVRECEALTASAQFGSAPCSNGVAKVTVRVHNLTSSDSRETIVRGDALNFSLVSAHTILGVKEGEFLSLLDPPTGFEDLVGQCSNIGTWPVLIGDQAETMLSSPIILYDHPQIAPESAGNLFDSLRILTLTDDEKREMRQSDDRAREILERTENMPEEQFMKLHGVLRGLALHKEEAR